MGKMRKLDSFMRESQRVNGINSSECEVLVLLRAVLRAFFIVTVTRKAMQDVTFSNGTTIPAGTMVVAAATATHMDEGNYANATTFDPWRFSDMREEDGESLKHQFVSTSVEYVSFGHGKHAW